VLQPVQSTRIPDAAMNTKRILSLAVGILALGFASNLRADEPAKPAVDLKAKLEELRGLPPEERRVKQREFLQSLTPEQRQEIRKLRGAAANGGARPRAGGPERPSTPAEQIEALKKRSAERVAALEKKKADGTITEQETKRLEQMQKRLEAKSDKPKAEKPAKTRPEKRKAAKEEPQP